MNTSDTSFITFLKDYIKRKKLLPSQLAANLDISHATISRWLSGKDIPSIKSCIKLSEYSGINVHRILALAGYLPDIVQDKANNWPEFRDYAQHKYPNELDEDLITMIEDLIERKRIRKHSYGRQSELEK